ncbi:hypothetical protein BDZ89DRAFT_615897 [Hymenopellis radicata]|nr:hypothetical protein BDZ89DRAFT_615897 [Hymenopellis radicata]
MKSLMKHTSISQKYRLSICLLPALKTFAKLTLIWILILQINVQSKLDSSSKLRVYYCTRDSPRTAYA